MTDDEINRAVAERLGDFFCGCGHLGSEHSDGRAYGNGSAVCSHAFCKCEEIETSDYANDIKAAYEVITDLRTKGYYIQLLETPQLSRCSISFSDTGPQALSDQKPGQLARAIWLAFLNLSEAMHKGTVPNNKR